MKEKINAGKEEIQKIANQFGISQEVVNSFQYTDDPPLIKVSPNINPASIPDAAKLATYIERIERLEEERKELGTDMREVFAEAKGNGFDVKVMRQILRLRKMTAADRAESEYLRDEYKKLLGIAE